MCSLFVSASLTIEALEAFELACEVCAVELINLFTLFFWLNHFSKLGVLLFKLDWPCKK